MRHKLEKAAWTWPVTDGPSAKSQPTNGSEASALVLVAGERRPPVLGGGRHFERFLFNFKNKKNWTFVVYPYLLCLLLVCCL